MLERVLKLIVALTFLVFLMKALIGVLCHTLEGFLHSLIGSLSALGGIVAALAIHAAVLSVAAGLIVRLTRFLTAQNPRAVQQRAARERAGRTRVRRPAEGAPVYRQEDPPVDPDPAINAAED